MQQAQVEAGPHNPSQRSLTYSSACQVQEETWTIHSVCALAHTLSTPTLTAAPGLFPFYHITIATCSADYSQQAWRTGFSVTNNNTPHTPMPLHSAAATHCGNKTPDKKIFQFGSSSSSSTNEAEA